MEIKPVGISCKYDAGMVCFYLKECTFPTIEDCLRQNLYLAQKEISLLKQRRNLKHTRISVKWRDSAFYYKKKAMFLEHYIKEKGLPLPNVAEMYPKIEVKDERLGDSEEENLDDEHRTDGGSTKREVGDNQGGQNIPTGTA